MKNSIVLASIVVVLQFVSACSALSKPSLKEFKSEAGGFSVNAPNGEMKENVQNIPTAAGSIQLTMYQATAGNNAYIAGYSNFPDAVIKQASADQLLDGAREGALGNIQGKLVSDKKIMLGNNPGRESVMDGKAPTGQEATARVRYYLVGNRLYQVMVVTPRGQANAPEMDEYLNSFKLNG